MKSTHSLAALGLAALVLAAAPAIAGGDHDHGAAAPAAASTASPRFAAVSELFELVGVLDGRLLTLYLDRFADNAPVRGAQIELEIAGVKFMAEKQGEEAYQVTLKDAPQPGVLPITATVTAGNDVDLLAGELDLHEEAHAHEHAISRRKLAGWALGGLFALAVLVLGGRRLISAPQARTGGVA